MKIGTIITCKIMNEKKTNPSALSCKVGSHFILISTAHPWEVSCGALLLERMSIDLSCCYFWKISSPHTHLYFYK